MASPVAEILKMSGKYHLPLLHANAEALDKGEQYFSFDINGTAFKREAHERHSPCLLACLLACLPACPAKTLCRLIQRIKGSASNRA